MESTDCSGTEKDARIKHPIIYSLLIMSVSVVFLGFACTKYYIDVAEGFVDEFASLSAHAFWIGLVLALLCRRKPRHKKVMAFFYFAIILSAIASYKSITLIGEAYSAKNAIKKFSTMLNDVNEGKQISNEKITQAQYGELSGFVSLMNDYMHDVQMDVERMNKELEDCNYASITDPGTLFQYALSPQRQFNFERVQTILKQYEEITIYRFNEFETRIRTSGLSEKQKERALSSFNRTKTENLKGSLDLIKLMEAWVSEAQSFLAFMKEKQADWTYENGQFSFQSSEDANIFNSHIKSFQHLTKEMTSLQEKVNAEFMQKQKELENVMN